MVGVDGLGWRASYRNLRKDAVSKWERGENGRMVRR